MIVNFGKNSTNFINVYLYKIEDGNISGKYQILIVLLMIILHLKSLILDI